MCRVNPTVIPTCDPSSDHQELLVQLVKSPCKVLRNLFISKLAPEGTLQEYTGALINTLKALISTEILERQTK